MCIRSFEYTGNIHLYRCLVVYRYMYRSPPSTVNTQVPGAVHTGVYAFNCMYIQTAELTSVLEQVRHPGGKGDTYIQETFPVYETTSLEGIHKTDGFSAGSHALLIGTQ